MRPVNSKSLMHFLFDQMDKLDKKEIDVQTAGQMASLARQANNIMTYELKRAETQIKIAVHNKEYHDNIVLREVDAKAFDDTTE